MLIRFANENVPVWKLRKGTVVMKNNNFYYIEGFGDIVSQPESTNTAFLLVEGIVDGEWDRPHGRSEYFTWLEW